MSKFIVVEPERIAHAKHLYEGTSVPVRDIAKMLDLGQTTFLRRTRLWGWRPRNLRLADLDAAAKADVPLAEIREVVRPAKETLEKLSLLDRVRAAVESEIIAIESVLNRVEAAQLRSSDAERAARTLATLVRTLKEISALEKPEQESKPDNEGEFRDLEEFRPFKSWEDAAVDALQIDSLNRIGRGNWTIERALFQLEKYNGFGYRRYGLPSAYLWASTNIYRGGKFIADGKFSRDVWDTQLGVAALMARIIHTDASLSLPSEAPASSEDHPVNLAAFKSPETKIIQQRLNECGSKPPLKIDGIYGPKTKQAVRDFQAKNELQDDGIVGPLTWNVLNIAKAA